MSDHQQKLKIHIARLTKLQLRYPNDPDINDALLFAHELDMIEEKKRELTFFRNEKKTKATVSHGLVFSMFNTGMFKNPYAS